MSPRRWLKPLPMFWLLYISLRHSNHPEWVLSIFAALAIVLGIAWLLKPRPKPEIAYLGPVALREGARCLVCRDPLSGDVIHCGRCHTPHHRACFTYVGGCSIYACASRRAA